MRVSVFALMVLFIVSGQRAVAKPKSAYETVVQQVLGSLRETTKALGKIRDGKSAQAAKMPLRKAVAKFVAARARAEQMRQPDQAERERVVRKYQRLLAEAMTDFTAERRRTRRISGAESVLRELRPMFETSKKKNEAKNLDKK